MSWEKVTNAHKCPVCEKPDWCMIGDKAVKCMRVQSERICPSGGWYHPLDVRPVFVPKRIPPPRVSLPFDKMIAGWRAATTESGMAAFSKQSGLSVESLSQLQAVWAWNHGAWAFPMRDGDGRIVGVRLRSEDGRKWAVPGSQQGLFYSERIPQNVDMLLICEGPTSCAAAMDLGFFSVGRPSCMSPSEQVRAVFRRFNAKRALIVADADDKRRADGSRWNPGWEGANRLGETIGRKHIVWSAHSGHGKDLRDYKRGGGTMQTIVEAVKDFLW